MDDALCEFREGKISLLEIARRSSLSASGLYRHTRHLSASAANEPTAPLTTPKPEVLQPELTKDELLSRLENVWQEMMAGVNEAKESGDLHLLVRFLREAGRLLQTLGDWTGHFPRRLVSDQGGGGTVQIVLPALRQEPKPPNLIDIGPPKR